MNAPEINPILVGISACLVGQPVRYNGGHSQSKLCLQTLSEHFQFRPFCPEVAAGFGTPRPTMRLVGDPDNPELQLSTGSDDFAPQLIAGFQSQLPSMADLDGYVLMKNSPSCGLERIKVYRENGHPNEQKSPGLFTKAVQQQWPLLPLEEEGRLNDPHLRENFILRVYTHNDFRHQVRNRPSYHNLLQFHSRYKYLVMAHSYSAYRYIGRMLAKGHDAPLQQVIDQYAQQLFAAIAKPARRKGHANTLLHILGYLKQSVPGPLRQDIVDVVDSYRRGQVPLV
ncbi:MAG: DUF523 and DUF1722 domain-containing protein, partial [Porticoccaceae bacterium]|nr:DUF523 and DUF1722 domain-containing protein [Porticoccaceae bacterium]